MIKMEIAEETPEELCEFYNYKRLEVENGHLYAYVVGNQVHISWQDRYNPNHMEVLQLDFYYPRERISYFVQDGVMREDGHFAQTTNVPVKNLERYFDELREMHPDITKLIRTYLAGGFDENGKIERFSLAGPKEPYLFSTEEEEEVSSKGE